MQPGRGDSAAGRERHATPSRGDRRNLLRHRRRGRDEDRRRGARSRRRGRNLYSAFCGSHVDQHWRWADEDSARMRPRVFLRGPSKQVTREIEPLDIIIIGGGPTGLACAIEAQRAGFSYLTLEKGCVVNSLYNYPTQLVFFTTPELLEIGDLPFVCEREKPVRIEALKYYRRVVDSYQLRVNQYEKVTRVTGSVNSDGHFLVDTESTLTGKKHSYHSRKIIVAIGYYDYANT